MPAPTDRDERPARAPSLTGLQKLLAALFVLVPIVPQLLLRSGPTLLSPVDPTARWIAVGIGILFAQAIFWGLIGVGIWRPGQGPAKLLMTLLSLLFSAIYALIFGMMATPVVAMYELHHLPHDRFDRLYAIELVSAAGRGGPHAFVDPYGLRRWGLPLSRTDYDAFVGGRYTWRGLVCYRVVELRRGDLVGIEEPSSFNPRGGVLAKCQGGDPGVVAHDTDPRTGRIR